MQRERLQARSATAAWQVVMYWGGGTSLRKTKPAPSSVPPPASQQDDVHAGERQRAGWCSPPIRARQTRLRVVGLAGRAPSPPRPRPAAPAAQLHRRQYRDASHESFPVNRVVPATQEAVRSLRPHPPEGLLYVSNTGVEIQKFCALWELPHGHQQPERVSPQCRAGSAAAVHAGESLLTVAGRGRVDRFRRLEVAAGLGAVCPARTRPARRPSHANQPPGSREIAWRNRC